MNFSHHIYVYWQNTILLVCRNRGIRYDGILVVVWGGTNGEIIYVLPFEKNSGKMLGCLSSFPHIQFFFVLVLITRSSRERKFDSSDEVRQYVWVLEQVNIMNLVRCLFWIAICFLWRDKNICLATIRLYFASLTHAIRTYIVKYSDKRIVAFLFSVFLLFFFFHYYFHAALFLLFRIVNSKLNIMAYKYRSCWEFFFIMFCLQLT